MGNGENGVLYVNTTVTPGQDDGSNGSQPAGDCVRTDVQNIV